MLEPLLIKVAGLQATEEHLRTTASVVSFLMAPVLASHLNKVVGLQATEEYLRTTASVVSFSWHLCWSLFFINCKSSDLQLY